MSLQETVEFVQRHFGDNRGVPNLPNVRPPLPPWLEGRIEAALPIEQGDRLVTEGTPAEDAMPSEAGDGASVEDLFAYYLPFHFYKKGWGAYIRAYGIERLARLLTASGPLTVPSVLFGFRLLLEHERLHFLAELAASRLEVASGLPSYGSYFRDRSAAIHEEALANAHAFSRSKRGVSAALVQAAYSWMANQGPGYRDFPRWLGSHLPIGKRDAAAFMLAPIRSVSLPSTPPRGSVSRASGRTHSSPGAHPPLPAGPAEFLFLEPRRLWPPTYLVVDRPVPWLRVVRPFPKVFGLQVLVHTNDHKPPHIHIRVLRRRQETKYEWPVLRPLRGNPPLSRSDEKSLRAYVSAMLEEIEAKVKSVSWM